MAKKKKNIFQKILNSLYYDRFDGKTKKGPHRLPVDKEADRLRSNSAGTY